MRNPQGFAEIISPEGVQKFDPVTCIHCGHIDMTRGPVGRLEVMVFRRDGSHYFKEADTCRSCYQPICPACVGKPCNNRFKRMDEEEKLFRKILAAGGS